MSTVAMAASLPDSQQDEFISETLSVDNEIPWLWLGGAAAVGTLGLILLLRR